MLEWLLPICVFWILISTYLGGWPVKIEGGSGLRQVLGVVATFVLFLVLWAVLHAILGGFGVFGRTIVPTVLAVLAIPAESWLAFKIMGVRVSLGGATGH